MALNPSAIRQALSDQIVAGTDREVHGYPYPTGGSYELPCVVVRSGEDYINHHADQGLECDVNLILDVMARTAVALEDGLLVLDELLSAGAGLPNSVVDAIEADETLGGAVESVQLGVVGQQEGFGTVEEGRPQGVLVSIPLQVWVARS